MIDQILKMLEGEYAENTLRAYASDMLVFARKLPVKRTTGY